ncbi:hypothetical protein NQ318_005661 [Aromia moschata]|uniref:Uncharacterized protein n=1 Tax=Aromia moschata TaxID=1265417 RepID=A0AAV8XYT7_9CUCU|nr:hypothetical protein NQ318_005661 [Aromia moschata]
MPKKHATTVEPDEWDTYARIDVLAISLVVATVVTAESPNQRPHLQRQTAPAVPYQPRGWRPSGPTFDINQKLQRQQQAPAEPSPSYGPPPSASYGPPVSEPTTTEQPTTTEAEIEGTTEPQSENLAIASQNIKAKPAKIQKASKQAEVSPVYVVLPQGQALIYAAPLSVAKSAPLVKPANKDVELVKEAKEPKLAPVQAIPALAKIQAPLVFARIEQAPKLVQYQQVQAVPVARYASSLSQTSVYTPYSSSYVEVYQ